MELLDRINAIWQKVSLVQRALLIAVGLTCVVAAVLLTKWAGRPDMRVLYQEIEPSEASKITEKISEQGIAYELRDGGTTIRVPKEHVYQLRLDMAKEGLPVGGQQGYKIFDNAKVGVSPKVQDINMIRALQDELARSVQMIEGVRHARIHIVSSKRSLFASKTGNTTASVMLQLRSGYRLSPSTIAAIRHLVAGGVEGLESEHVTITDNQGNLLARESDETTDNGAGTVQDYRERVEKNFEEKAVDMLSTFLGPGRASVKVTAVLDMQSGNMVTESFDPTKKVTKKEEITTNSKTDSSTVSSDGEPTVTGGVTKDEVAITEFAVGKTVEQTVDLPGDIKSLSVAAVVDLSIADANGVVSAAGPKIMPVEKVEELIANALGLSLTAEDGSSKSRDSLSVVETVFYHQPESDMEAEMSPGLDYVAIAGQASLGIMAICALLVLKILGKAKKGSEVAVGMNSPQLAASAEGTAAGLLGGGEESEPVMLRKQIAGILKDNPDQVKQLFTSWVEDKGE